MKTFTLPVDRLKPGMRIASDILYGSKVPYILKDTILNEFMIQKLLQLEVPMVIVYYDSAQDLEKNNNEYHSQTESFSVTYSNTLDTVRDYLKELKTGKVLPIKKIQASALQLVDMILTNSNILGRMRLMQKKDEYTYTHLVNVSILAAIIGKWLQLKNEVLYHLACAGLLHDIGKIRIKSTILNKPSSLTETEYLEMKTHPAKGFNLLLEVPDLNKGVILACLHHHERFDGTGYPLKLTGEEIHLYGRIVAVADVYDAMTSDRVYRRKFSPFKVAEEIASSRFGCLDPNICHIFLQNITSLYTGNKVRLSNGLTGEVIMIKPEYPTRPVIRCQDKFIDLSQDKSLSIEEILS